MNKTQMMIKALDVIEDAKKVIKKKWCKEAAMTLPDGTTTESFVKIKGKHLKEPGAKFCAIGAVYAVSPNAKVANFVIEKLDKATERAAEWGGGCGYDSIVDFNDAYDTTRTQVLRKFTMASHDIQKELGNL